MSVNNLFSGTNFPSICFFVSFTHIKRKITVTIITCILWHQHCRTMLLCNKSSAGSGIATWLVVTWRDVAAAHWPADLSSAFSPSLGVTSLRTLCPRKDAWILVAALFRSGSERSMSDNSSSSWEKNRKPESSYSNYWIRLQCQIWRLECKQLTSQEQEFSN